MQLTFLLVAEGLTDLQTMEKIIRRRCAAVGMECTVRFLFPNDDASGGRRELGGWSRLKRFCLRHRAGPMPELEMSEKDRETWKLAGLRRPVVTRPVSWKSHLFEPASFLVFHLDGDVADELPPEQEGGAAALDRAARCAAALRQWTGLDGSEAAWCVPVHCLETWFLAILVPGCRDPESLATEDVYRLLVDSGETSFSDGHGGVTADKVELVRKHADALAEQFAQVGGRCPSAAKFASDMASILGACPGSSEA